MPAQRFTVHIDATDLAAALSRPQPEAPPSAATTHHGARDPRQAARLRSGRTRSGRAATAGGGRSYAFRRS